MTEQPQVGDTVRLTVTRTHEGKVYKNKQGVLCIENWDQAVPIHTIKILSHATSPTPTGPGTWWLDRALDVWTVSDKGSIDCLVEKPGGLESHGPFRQLVTK